MVKCVKCNKELDDNTNFCPECGNPIQQAPPEPEKESKIDKNGTTPKKKRIGCLPILATLILAFGMVSILNKISPPPTQTQTPSTQDEPKKEVRKGPLQIDLTGTFSTTALAVGQTVSAQMTIKNKDTRVLDGYSLALVGGWKNFTITGVDPGSFDNSIGMRINVPAILNPGETATVTIDAVPNKAGNFRLDMIPYQSNGISTEDTNGQSIMIGCDVAVTP